MYVNFRKSPGISKKCNFCIFKITLVTSNFTHVSSLSNANKNLNTRGVSRVRKSQEHYRHFY